MLNSTVLPPHRQFLTYEVGTFQKVQCESQLSIHMINRIIMYKGGPAEIQTPTQRNQVSPGNTTPPLVL